MTDTGKIVCFGELLLRYSPVLGGQWIADARMPVYIGGAELNAATALALWHLPIKYCTALPDNYWAKEIAEAIGHKNIDTTAIQFSGDRIGAYMLLQGADLKNAGVIYDRAHSSFAELKPGAIDWDVVLGDCSWFHFSAISPALSEQAAAVCLEAVRAAAAKGLTISVDLNYRAKLWQYGKKPPDIMPQLLRYCDVVMGNIWSVEALLGLPSAIQTSTGLSQEILVDAAGQSMLQLQKAYPKITTTAYTFRLQDTYFGVLRQGPVTAVSPVFSIADAVDKVGSGDCFMAGLIYGLYHRHRPQAIIDFAAAAATGKMGEVGDATQQRVAAINKRLTTNGQ
jgi:2-dehydro-3-deoxygluconokinase